jgi:hypothetical protein
MNLIDSLGLSWHATSNEVVLHKEVVMRRLVPLVALCVLLAAVGAASAQPVRLIYETHGPGDGESRKPTRPYAISVDCTRGESINKALEKVASKKGVESVVEIHGMCEENVVVRGLTNVTLRGTDPEQDGIRSVGQENELFPYSSALMIADSHVVRVENLMLTGWRPLRTMHADSVNVVNCQVIGIDEGRPVYYSAHSIGVTFTSTTVSSPDSWGVFAVSSSVSLNDSAVVADLIGVYSGSGGSVYTENLTVNAAGFAVYADEAGNAWIKTSELAGEVVSSLNGSVVLTGVTQTDHGAPGWNGVFERSSLQVWNGSQLLGPVYVGDFSITVVQWGSTVHGDLECWSGGDAFCENPGNIWGAYGCPSIPFLSAAESATSADDSRPDLSSLRRELRLMRESEKLD